MVNTSFLCYNLIGDIMKKAELLSPVGNMESLYQAVLNGADAVYLGGKKFGARKYADNFDYDEMLEAIKFCHLYGVKIYVTVNTIIFESEIEEALKYIEFLHENNVDALIVQDLGLIRLIRKKFPNLELHASTQCHNHNEESIRAIKELGVSRVVLARELSLKEIKNIKVDIEKEVFIHGALCVAYSGCCLFSSINGGRSGNRGECVGSCRLPYQLLKNNSLVKTDGNYILSTKSLCTIENIGELIESGITSFKIEGRMKSPEYIGYITKLYRTKIDEYYNSKNLVVTEEEIDNIKKLYNRGLTKGYLFGDYGKKIMNIKTSNHIGIPLGKVIYVDKKIIKILADTTINQEDGLRFDNDKGMIINKLYNNKKELVSSIKKGEIAIVDNKIGLSKASYVRKTIDSKLVEDLRKVAARKINVEITLEAKINKPLKIILSDDNNVIEEYGDLVQIAINSPTDKERIKEQLEKLGNTPFISKTTNIDMDNNIFVSIKSLNELRRNAFLKLKEKREYSVPHPFIKNENVLTNIPYSKEKQSLKINLLVRNEEQLKTALEQDIGNIYVNDYTLYKKYENCSNVFYKTKRVGEFYKDFKNKNILATELGAVSKYAKMNNVVSDYYLNVVNSSSISYLLESGVRKVTLSVETNMEDIKKLKKYGNLLEILVYGRVELMITKYCPLNMLLNNDDKKCNLCCENNKYALKDQAGNIYPLIYEKHLTHVMHSKNINLINNIKEYKSLGINSYRIELFDEKKSEIIKIIKEIKKEYE